MNNKLILTIKDYLYIIVLSTVLIVLSYLTFGLQLMFAKAVIIDITISSIFIIDLNYKIIPNKVLLLAFIISFLFMGYFICTLDFIIGGFMGGVIFFLLIVLTNGGIGGGDMKYIIVLGMFLGTDVLKVILLSFLISFPICLVLLLLKKKKLNDTIAFGPFISIATFIVFHINF